MPPQEAADTAAGVVADDEKTGGDLVPDDIDALSAVEDQRASLDGGLAEEASPAGGGDGSSDAVELPPSDRPAEVLLSGADAEDTVAAVSPEVPEAAPARKAAVAGEPEANEAATASKGSVDMEEDALVAPEVTDEDLDAVLTDLESAVEVPPVTDETTVGLPPGESTAAVAGQSDTLQHSVSEPGTSTSLSAGIETGYDLDTVTSLFESGDAELVVFDEPGEDAVLFDPADPNDIFAQADEAQGARDEDLGDTATLDPDALFDAADEPLKTESGSRAS